MTLTKNLTSSLTSSLTSLLTGKDGIDLSFTSTWKTDNIGTSNDDQISLPLEASGTYNFSVDWGDGNSDTITVWNQAETTHTYASAGTYTIKISGAINGWSYKIPPGDREKILNISNWGTLILGNSGDYFRSAKNLTVTATDILDISSMTTYENFFRSCSALTTVPSINEWDTSSIINMSGAYNSSGFNSPIGNQDVSQVLTMRSMCNGDTAFNQDVSNFDVSLVGDMTNIFVSGGMSRANYDLLLVAWEALPSLQNGVPFSIGSTQYSAGAPATARANIISNFSWTITDGGQAP